MTNLVNESVRIQELGPTLNPQFRGGEPAALLHAAGEWLAAHPDASVVALNLTNFDLRPRPERWRVPAGRVIGDWTRSSFQDLRITVRDYPCRDVAAGQGRSASCAGQR